jgi:hypothetical protein
MTLTTLIGNEFNPVDDKVELFIILSTWRLLYETNGQEIAKLLILQFWFNTVTCDGKLIYINEFAGNGFPFYIVNVNIELVYVV